MFRIHIDNKGLAGTKVNCMLLNKLLSIDETQEQVMFDIPLFQMENYALFKENEGKPDEDPDIKRNRPFHVFVVKQMTYGY